MLSIIVSSYNYDLFSSLEQNIENTCGVSYELIRIENLGIMSINEAYNLGISKSKFEHLLFIHEDILFETKNWGKVLIDLFRGLPDVGLIGVAGTRFKTKAPSGWGESGDEFNEIFIKQYDGGKLIKDFTIDKTKPPYKDVVVLDGVFLSTRRSFNLRFDDTLDGFHNYDIAIASANNKANRRAIVSFEIIIKHLSNGNYGHDWVLSTHQFYKKYKKFLPLATEEVSNQSEIEKAAYYKFLSKCLYYGEFKLSVYYIVETFKNFPFSRLPYTMIIKACYRLPWFFRSVKFKS